MIQKAIRQVTLQETAQAMAQLIVPGKVPSGINAVYNAALSIRNTLERNCMQAIVMRQYANSPLPVNHDELRAKLGGQLVMLRTVNTLYEIERLWHAGIIHFNTGSTFEEQAIWRNSMVAAIPGMGDKTVSFALHIYAPNECKLLTIDCWHLKRLGMECITLTHKRYLECEQLLRDDCLTLQKLEPGYDLIVYAAYFWERTRQESKHHQKFYKVDGYQSHAGLSCYV